VLKPHLTNWTEVVHYFVRSVEADAAVDGTTQTGALLQRLLRYPGVRAAMAQAAPSAGDGPVLPMLFRRGQTALRLFTTIATLGTPRDVTLQELRIESFFPMDDATGDVFRKWSRSSGRR
jgi:hypothetical protein